MLRFIKIGTGPHVMIGFHGFGRDANMFKVYDKVFPEYTIYSLSLFYHGSDWVYQDAIIDEQGWKSIFGSFLAHHNIQQFSLLGFSLGGKMALYTFQLFSNQIDSLHLIAPYGVKNNPVEWLIQKLPFVYKRLEKYVHKPDALLKILAMLQKYKLVNRTLLSITMRQMDSLENRSRIFHSMLLYGGLRLNLKAIRKKLESSGIAIIFYVGHYDQILPIKTLNKHISTRMNFSLHVFPNGHASLPDKVAQSFKSKADITFEY